MNKRFFTLMAAVLLAGAPLCNEAFAADPVDLTASTAKVDLANGLKFVIAYQLGGTTAGYIKVKPVEGTAFVTVDLTNESNLTKATVFEVRNYSGGKFELWANGKQFVTKESGTSTGASNTIEVFDPNTATDITKEFVAKKGGTVATTTDFNQLFTFKVGTGGTQLWSAVTLVPNTISETLDAAKLNEINTSSTTFSFDAESLEGNVFQSVTPFTFAIGDLAAGSAAGTYFVSGAADDIKKLKAANTPADRAAALKKLNVVYVKNELWGLNTKGTGEGYKVVTISGAEFYKQAPAKAAFFDNAAFTSIVEGDQLNNEGAVVLTIKPKVGKDDATIKSVTVAAVKASASDTKAYVTTVANVATESYDNKSQFKTVINPTLGDNTYFAASEFLKKGGVSAYNIYFPQGTASSSTSSTEYHKYLTKVSNGTSFALNALAADYVDLSTPAAQWIATNFDGKYTLTLSNRQTNETLEVKLNATDVAGEYKIVGGSNASDAIANTTLSTTLANKVIRLIPTSLSEYDGSLNLTKAEMEEGITLAFTGKNAAIGEQTFYVTTEKDVYGNPTATNLKLVPTLDSSAAAKLSIAKVQDADKNDYAKNITKYAYLDASGKVVTNDEAKADTLIVPAYTFSIKIGATDYVVKQNFALDATASSASSYFINRIDEDTYTVTYYDGALSATAYSSIVNNAQNNALGVNTTGTSATGDKFTAQFGLTTLYYDPANVGFAYLGLNVNDNTDLTTLEAEPRYATFDSWKGSVAFEENEDGILEGILSAAPMTFHLDTADSDAKTPSFYISRGIVAVEEEAPATKADEAAIKMRNFMYFPKDSAEIFDEGSATSAINYDYILEGTELTSKDKKAIFRPAAIVAEDTLAAVVEGKEVTVLAEKANASKGEVNGLSSFQFGIRLVDPDYEDYYVIYPKADKSLYLYSLNGLLGFTNDPNKALVVTLGEGDPTANEAIAAESGVQVIGGQGVVTVQGAAGKVVTVANILGQTIANQVAVSDNVTIAVPAGIVVVAVDGEATKVVVK